MTKVVDESNTSSTSSNRVGISSAEFSDFFRDVHDVEPFPWQKRLATQVLSSNKWPDQIDLPTGTGKTAVLDIAVFALAANPDLSPRRIVFVVDRRIIVDQVYSRAKKILERVQDADTEILEKVRDRLKVLCPTKDHLGVVMLKGGIPIDNEWSLHPDQPWVLVSTVDQFGSRLLFRGYGVSPGMWPISAGLAGNDCLVILDEVHLSLPFLETLSNVSNWETKSLPRRFAVVEMSATPKSGTTHKFSLTRSDLEECSELRRRIEAHKRAKLVSVKNQDSLPKKTKELVQTIKKQNSQISSIGVIVNRVRTARKIYELLIELGYTAHLITGRMRPLDRVDVVDAVELVVNPDKAQHSDGLEVVVATQAIEVGADFDFDVLISECASFDSLQQRFGRLNRRGKLTESDIEVNAWIIGENTIKNKTFIDPIYGESLKSTWNQLNEIEKCQEYVDFSAELVKKNLSSSAYSKSDVAPQMLKTHMENFVQTRPKPIVGSSVEWFLHGINHDNFQPEVSLVWRWDNSLEALNEVPPRRVEMMQVPISAVKSWLNHSKEVDISDTLRYSTGKQDSLDKQDKSGADEVKCIRWQSSKHSDKKIEEIYIVDSIQPGDVLVINPQNGGVEGGTWNPTSSTQVKDLGDQSQLEYGHRVTLRLDAKLNYCSHKPPTPSDEEELVSTPKFRITEWLEKINGDESVPKDHWLNRVVNRLLDSDYQIVKIQHDYTNVENQDYYVLREVHKDTKKRRIDDSDLDSTDESNSLTGTATTLESHLEGVGERARSMACRLGFPDSLAHDLYLAGRLHDLGKVDSRFQEMLVGGDPIEIELRRETPLAKSLSGIHISRRFNYPKGMRHEIASVAMIESNLEVLKEANDSELVLHLVGTHHGWGRPLPPVIEDSNPETLTYSIGGIYMEVSSRFVDSEVAISMAERFWGLIDKYGFYGLAWMESILRLADHQQSAHEASTS